MTDSTANTFTVVAVSEVETSGTNHTFTIERNPMGAPRIVRECEVDGEGGCPDGGVW